MTISDKLNDLITAKADMKAALQEKGVAPTGGLSTYADAIRDIEGGDVGIWKIPETVKFGYSQFSTIPAVIDTSNVKDAWFLFGECDKLSEVRSFNTSNMTQWHYMFWGSINIHYVAELDASNVYHVSYMFGHDYYDDEISNVYDLDGFTNLGKQRYMVGTEQFLHCCPNLTRQSLINVFNKLYDRASAGYEIMNIKLHYNAFKRLTDADIAIATNKGWTVTS